MSEVFADSFYFIAVINPRDAHHATAIELSQKVTRPAVTTLWVLIEVADALCDVQLRVKTHQFISTALRRPGFTVLTDFEPWLSRGLALYGSRLDKDWSLTDCISFEMMKDRGINDALTGDRHFAQAGFRPLLTPPTNCWLFRLRCQRVGGDQVFFDDAAGDEMFLNDLLEDFRRATHVPSPFGIHDCDRASLADAKAIGFRPRDAARFGELELHEPFLEILPGGETDLLVATFRFRLIAAKKDMPTLRRQPEPLRDLLKAFALLFFGHGYFFSAAFLSPTFLYALGCDAGLPRCGFAAGRSADRIGVPMASVTRAANFQSCAHGSVCSF
jgi:uncharacterized protein